MSKAMDPGKANGQKPAGAFSELCRKFRPFHKNSLNVLLHLLTTPAGVLAIFLMVNNQPITMGASALYLLSLFFLVPTRVWLRTSLVIGLINLAASWMQLTLFPSLMLLAVSYFGQDLAHFVTNEPTFQGSYQNQSNFFELLMEHTFYLIPLVVDSMDHMDGTFTTLYIARNDVLQTTLDGPKDKDALQKLSDWTHDQKPVTDRTTHWWYNKLPASPKAAFTALAESAKMKKMFSDRFSPSMYAVEVLDGMNELYVANKSHNNDSDKVFYMNHVDGPLSVYPFVHVYRCLVAVNKNEQIQTVCPMVPDAVALSSGKVLGIDFHREVHRIQHNPNGAINDGYRITLKVHFVVYPKCLGKYGKFLGMASTTYNQLFRLLFLTTIQPKSLWGRFLAHLVLTVTTTVHTTEEWIGWNNVAFVCALGLANKHIHPAFFITATSFIHYCKYIATYYYRDVAFGAFKRDVMFYKMVSLSQLAYHYVTNFQFDIISLALIIVGYGIATSASMVIGLDRTYFGAELGLMAPKWINQFPYTHIPHPMILGACTGLLGVMKMDGLRSAIPFYIIPLHICFYLAHCVQEIYDWKQSPLPKAVAERLASFDQPKAKAN
jgi:hypothetical protein